MPRSPVPPRVLRRIVAVALLAVAPLAARAQEPPAEDRFHGPWLQALLSESALVLWRTDAPGIGQVEARALPDGAPRVFVEDAPRTEHRVALAPLAPDTVHEYTLGDGRLFRFRTAPAAGAGTARAVVIGDSGGGGPAQAAVAALVSSLEPDLFLHTGDLSYIEDRDRAVFDAYRHILPRACFYPARGNHDNIPLADWWAQFVPPDADPPLDVACAIPGIECDAPPPAPALPADPPRRTAAFYSFDWGPAHFAVLDFLDDFSPCSAQQLAWLCRDLGDARARGMPWLIVMVHGTVFTRGLHCTVPTSARQLLPAIADRFEVDLVLSGHDHNYQRSRPVRSETMFDRWQEPAYVRPRGTIYLITGGGGSEFPYGECNVDAPSCDARCKRDAAFMGVFANEYHAVELEITPHSLAGRAIAAAPARMGEIIDAFRIDKLGERRELAFLRGDTDGDGKLLITDPVRILTHLFVRPTLDCAAPADAQDDGSIDIADAIYILGYLFLNPALPPPPPFPACAALPGANDPWCDRSGCGGAD